MKAATLGHAISTFRLPDDRRDRDHVLDIVGKLWDVHPIMGQPVTVGMFTNPGFLDVLSDYAEGDATLAASMGIWLRRVVDIVEEAPQWDDVPEYSWFLNLREVLAGEFEDRKFLLKPLLPLGRQISIYASGKTGKSLLMLEIACALATGTPIWDNPKQAPIHVLYADFEMTPQDLKERLETLGYDIDHPLFPVLEAHLHYAQLQPFAPFDTREGGEQLEQLVRQTGATAVIIDTLIRSVEGEENSADTIKAFYRYTGQRLKAMGVTVVRIDHAGKDASRGQRGTSAKRDDVDVVWWLTNSKEELKVTCEASRMAWLPQEFTLRRIDDPDSGTMRHQMFELVETRHSEGITWDIPNCRIWHDVTEDWATYGDPATSLNKALESFRAAGKVAQRRRFNAVLGHMREVYVDREPPREPPREPLSGNQSGTGSHD